MFYANMKAHTGYESHRICALYVKGENLELSHGMVSMVYQLREQ